MLFVAYLLNHLSNPAFNHETPTFAATGQRPDISNLLHFKWWDDVYYLDPESSFPSKSKEKAGKWVGVAEHKGDAMTYWILTADTDRVIPRSVVRLRTDEDPNLRADDACWLREVLSEQGESGELFHDPEHPPIPDLDDYVPVFNPDDLVGRTFLRKGEDDLMYRAEVIKRLNDEEAANHQKIKYLVKIW